MDGSSNNSFIPKRGPSNRPKRVTSQRVYVITLVSYVLFFATLAAAAGVFLYGRYIDSQFQTEVALLSDEIERFNDVDLNKVLDFDERLQKAQDRLDVAVSLGSIFTAIENSTVKTVQLDSLRVERKQDESFDLIASIKTDNFDSSIFQREVFEQNSVISSVEISELTISPNSLDQSEARINLTDSSEITLTAKLGVSVADVPFIPKSSASILSQEPELVNTEASGLQGTASTTVVETTATQEEGNENGL